MNVQAFLDNISFPKTLEELESTAQKFDVERILTEANADWTVPKWATQGDIVFFFHAKTAIQWIRKLETQLKRRREYLEDEKIEALENALKRARKLHKNYGGKIFAVGQVSNRPFYDSQSDEIHHWNSKFYANIHQICVLHEPIDISEFSHFVFVSRQSAITPIIGDDFERLKELIETRNKIPGYLENSKAVPLPLSKINAYNWLEVTKIYRRLFSLEIQFRRFYVDYFLRTLGDQKRFLAECECYRCGKRTGFADNAVKLNGRWCFVEVKLNVKAEIHLHDQVKKYCMVDSAALNGERVLQKNQIWQKNIVVIDTENIYMYFFSSDKLTVLESLDEISTETGIKAVREMIIPLLQ